MNFFHFSHWFHREYMFYSPPIWNHHNLMVTILIENNRWSTAERYEWNIGIIKHKLIQTNNVFILNDRVFGSHSAALNTITRTDDADTLSTLSAALIVGNSSVAYSSLQKLIGDRSCDDRKLIASFIICSHSIIKLKVRRHNRHRWQQIEQWESVNVWKHRRCNRWCESTIICAENICRSSMYFEYHPMFVRCRIEHYIRRQLATAIIGCHQSNA